MAKGAKKEQAAKGFTRVRVKGNSLVVGQQVVATLFGVSTSAVKKWEGEMGLKQASGMPDGYYDLKEVIDWRIKMLVGSDSGKTSDLRTAKMAVDLQYRKTRSEREKLLLEILRDEYYSKEEAVEEWATRALELKIALLDWSKTLPMELAGRDLNEMESILHARACEILGGFCRRGKYTFDPERD